MNIKLSNHAHDRMKDKRQNDITYQDIIEAAKKVPGNLTMALKINHFKSKKGRNFSIVIKDINSETRLIVTVIGDCQRRSR